MSVETWEEKFDRFFTIKNGAQMIEYNPDQIKMFIRGEISLTQQVERNKIMRKIRSRQILFNFIPRDKNGYKMVKESDLDIVGMIENQ